jgi:hypothetical protein
MSDCKTVGSPEHTGTHPLREFPIFGSFPIELRLLVWEATLKPRVVELKHRTYDKRGWTSRAELPVALQVCQESRVIISTHYPLSFGGPPDNDSPPRVRFNFALDTVLLSYGDAAFVSRFVGSLRPLELARLRSLAIHERHLLYPISSYLRSLTGLQELLIVCIVGRHASYCAADWRVSVRYYESPPESIIREKLLPEQFKHLEVWGKPICRSVYGFALNNYTHGQLTSTIPRFSHLHL